jgi:DNA-binding protein YbaB
MEELQRAMAMEMALWGSMEHHRGLVNGAQDDEMKMDNIDPDLVKKEAEKVLDNCYEHISKPFNDTLRAITKLHKNKVANLTSPKIIKP